MYVYVHYMAYKNVWKQVWNQFACLPIVEYMNWQLYLYKDKLHSKENEWATAAHNNIHTLHKHNTEGKKAKSQSYIAQFKACKPQNQAQVLQQQKQQGLERKRSWLARGSEWGLGVKSSFMTWALQKKSLCEKSAEPWFFWRYTVLVCYLDLWNLSQAGVIL